MKNIYLVRHGKTHWNTIGKIQGFKESELNQEGLLQGKKVAEYFKKIHIDKIYTSPLSRAYDTANLINKNHQLQLKEVDLLKEMCFGDWEGLKKDEITDQDKYMTWLKTPELVQIPGGENLESLRLRARKFISSLDFSSDETIVLVSHSAMIKMLIIELLDMDNKNFKNLSLSNTGVTKIEVKDYNRVLKFFNYTSHLKENI